MEKGYLLDAKAGAASGALQTRFARLAARNRARWEPDRVTIRLADKSIIDFHEGGKIDDIVLKDYHETVDPKSPNVTLFSPTDSPHPYFAEYGWVAQGGTQPKLPDRDTLWTAGPATLTPAAPVTLQWDNRQGLIFKRTISVDDDYMFKVIETVENKGAVDVSLAPYAPSSFTPAQRR